VSQAVRLLVCATITLTINSIYAQGGSLTPLIWTEVVAVWKSETDLESALNLTGEVTEETLAPYVACWASAGSKATQTSPEPASGLVRIQVASGDSSGCSGVVLREEYITGEDPAFSR
jgi:hypothetical protein